MVRSTDLVSTAASATIRGGISPELVLVTETSPELEELRKSSVLSIEEKPELVDVKSLSEEASSMAEEGRGGGEKRERMKGERKRRGGIKRGKNGQI